MQIENFTPLPALVGGLMIGLATGVVLWLNGKIAGLSGVLARILRPVAGDTAWRVWFLLGLIGGGAATIRLYGPAADFKPQATLPWVVVAGLLVGFGARLGGG